MTKKTDNILLAKAFGITETKIKVLDILIKLVKKQKSPVSLNQLKKIRKDLIGATKKAEMFEAIKKGN